MPTAPSSQRTAVLRSNAWAVSPALSSPGTLELAASTIAFVPHWGPWILGDFGGRPDMRIPLDCVSAVTTSSRLAGVLRLWPGRLLEIRLSSGRRIYFGVPRPEEWLMALARIPAAGRPCPSVDNRLSSISRSLALDATALLGGGAACVAILNAAGPVAAFASLGLLVGARYVIRLWFWHRAVDSSS